MASDWNNPSDFRVLVLAPTHRDGRATRELLDGANIPSLLCDGATSMARAVETTLVGTLLLTDAAFSDPHFDQLLTALSCQPSWSDIPVVLLARAAPASPSASRILDALTNVTLLERPTSARTLVSSVQAAVRARARQYELRRQLEALRASEAALRDADERKNSFLATLAHELRNPLAPILSAAHILTTARLEPQRIKWAQNVIQRQASHMALLLDDLLDIARITRGKLELKKERVKLTDVVDAAVETARPLLDSKHHELTITLPAEELTLIADPLRLSQVISNLLTNAAKYTDPAGHIELTGSAQDDMLCITVKDDGIGIPPEALSLIFEMFSQVDGSSIRAEGGLGIGLSLVQGLLELHGGTIDVSSEGPGQGSQFTVRLPLHATTSVDLPAGNPDAPPTGAASRRLMIADDNRDAADSLAIFLELSGHEVRVAYGGHAALAVAQTFHPDIALLDIGMPDLSGYEVAKELRREPWGADICLVAITGWGGDEDKQRAIDAGFDRHLTKPVDAGAVEAFLRR